jgi:hypothetical protein
VSECLDWTIHPFRQRRGLGIGVFLVILVGSFGAALWTKGWFWGVFSFFVLFLSLESFYFPTRYRLEEGKVVVFRRFSRSEREWGIFRRCSLDSDGLTLSPFRKSTWLEAYRAIRLRFGSGNRDEVVAYVRGRLKPDAEWIEGRRWKQSV